MPSIPHIAAPSSSASIVMQLNGESLQRLIGRSSGLVFKPTGGSGPQPPAHPPQTSVPPPPPSRASQSSPPPPGTTALSTDAAAQSQAPSPISPDQGATLRGPHGNTAQTQSSLQTSSPSLPLSSIDSSIAVAFTSTSSSLSLPTTSSTRTGPSRTLIVSPSNTSTSFLGSSATSPLSQYIPLIVGLLVGGSLLLLILLIRPMGKCLRLFHSRSNPSHVKKRLNVTSISCLPNMAKSDANLEATPSRISSVTLSSRDLIPITTQKSLYSPHPHPVSQALSLDIASFSGETATSRPSQDGSWDSSSRNELVENANREVSRFSLETESVPHGPTREESSTNLIERIVHHFQKKS